MNTLLTNVKGDFLTGVTVPTERKIQPGFENTFPRNADAILAEYERSPIRSSMASEYDYPNSQDARDRTESFKESIAFERNKHLPSNTVLTTSFMAQLKACTRRQYQILWGEKSTFLIKQVLSLAMSLIAGACFYNSPDTSAGLFTKGGAVFFSLLYNCIVAMSEVTESFKGRPVLVKHKSFGFYHPSAFCLAQITADIPVLLLQCTIFTVVIYWMTGLKATASAFFTFWAILWATTLVSEHHRMWFLIFLKLTNNSALRLCLDVSAPHSVPSKLLLRSLEQPLRHLSCTLDT